jgi:hypothetical protein
MFKSKKKKATHMKGNTLKTRTDVLNLSAGLLRTTENKEPLLGVMQVTKHMADQSICI